MGDNFTDGPKGEAERTDDGAGTTTHRPQDNRNISGSKAGPLAERLEDRDVADVGPPEEGTDSFAGVEKASSAFDRLRERDVETENAQDDPWRAPDEPEVVEVEDVEETFEDDADPGAVDEDELDDEFDDEDDRPENEFGEKLNKDGWVSKNQPE